MKRALLLVLVVFAASALQAANEAQLKRRGFFGVRTVTAEAGTGAQIREVLPGGLAAASGLKPADIITSVAGKKVNAPKTFEAAARLLRSGEKATVQYQRGGQTLTAEGTLADEPRETYASADVLYDEVIALKKNQRLRTIVTRPKNAQGKLPVIFVAGWLSDDSVEAPDDTNDASALLLRGLAEMPGFATFRMDKPGCGDSQGDAAETDFETELGGYRAAFGALSRYDFIDPNRIFILGISNGGGFAPLVPSTPEELARVRGFVSIGGWCKTWFEHMLEIERNRLTLDGKSPAEVTAGLKELAPFYDDLLVRGAKPAQLFQQREVASKLWPGDDPAHLYGRPIAFFQQLQKLNLAEAWGKVNVPTLVLHGQFDWIMDRDEAELIATIVNVNRPGTAEFVELPNTGHTLQTYTSMANAFRGPPQAFNRAHLKRIADWLTAHHDR